MSFRTRLLLACVPLALLPLVLFGLDSRREVTERLEAQHAERITALADIIREDLERESEAIGTRLERLAEEIGSDPRLRAAMLGQNGSDGADRGYLLEYARRVMPLTGLDALRIQADDGRILTSGHFRAEYDAVDPTLPAMLARVGNEALLVSVPTASGPILALVRQRTLHIGTASFTLMGGTAVDEAFLARLARGTGLDVELRTPEDGSLGEEQSESSVAAVGVPFGASDDPQAIQTARFEIRASDTSIGLLRRELNRRLLWTSLVAAALALLLAGLVSAQLGRPLAVLARRADRLDLDRLDTRFPTLRKDEIGRLATVLDRMAERLRAGTAKLRTAERRAATGDIARQVHHDVRNGLIPIRNVLGHLTQVARERPEHLAEIFLERNRTLESSVEHLHALAANYARLSPTSERVPCDLNRIVREVIDEPVASGGKSNLRVTADLAEALPPVDGDPAALRRITANLIGNAIESLEGRRGSVSVHTRLPRSGTRPHIELAVRDTGRGMSDDERRRVFDDFYSTKPEGTGLGLSIVRRLVADMGGRIDVESTPGRGTCFTVELPVAPGTVSDARATHDTRTDVDDAHRAPAVSEGSPAESPDGAPFPNRETERRS